MYLKADMHCCTQLGKHNELSSFQCHAVRFVWLYSETSSLKHLLLLIFCFKCDQICKGHLYEFGNTLLGHLALTLIFNKPTFDFLSKKSHDPSIQLKLPWYRFQVQICSTS